MNRCWAQRLVATDGRRGAELTDYGRTILSAYRALEATIDAATASSQAFALLGRSVRPEPLDRAPE
jgi:molybdate transport system regulatory protein